MSDRPDYCCGVCPETGSGGYDCTCRYNPRCPNFKGDEASTEAIAAAHTMAGEKQ